MKIWHGTMDAPASARRVSPGERVGLAIGTWPIEADQAVWITYRVAREESLAREGWAEAHWLRNVDVNSSWHVEIGPFAAGDFVVYTIHGRSQESEVQGPIGSFRVKPRLYLALLWHQHQPLYRDLQRRSARGSYLQPWVRLHALRDYYSMAALVASHPGVHLTINLTPCLLWQIEDYVERGATDRALELTLEAAERLTTRQREEILSTFFDADWHNQIFPHRRYRELFEQRRQGRAFTDQDLRDLQMWATLAWFGAELRGGEVALPGGQTASVRRFVEQGRDFSPADILAMVTEQRKVMAAVVPLHRLLQDRGQIEISTTPFFHPILPLLLDSDQATVDLPGASLPHRFAHPEDAAAQVGLAIAQYRGTFGRDPRGVWPAEGAVSAAAASLLARHGFAWLATDSGVLARSGRWGYRVEDPEVLCQPYRPDSADSRDEAMSVFFRDPTLSDGIGFRYHGADDYREAAAGFVREIRERFASRLRAGEDRVLTVVLDGENAWGAYRHDARPFLHALYGQLEHEGDIQTVTFSEFLEGDAGRGVSPHPISGQPSVDELATGSWIDEVGSAPGVDLGTWIGEEEENRAWNLLGNARMALARAGATPASSPAAFQSLYAAEGSDWFWWFGSDQDSGHDADFDDLFRRHLRSGYRAAGLTPPAALARHLVPHAEVWTFSHQVAGVQQGDRLVVCTNCPGDLHWQLDEQEPASAALTPVGGVMAGVQRYVLTLGPFPLGARQLRFRFRCTHPNCDCRGSCCSAEDHHVAIRDQRARPASVVREGGTT